MYYGAKGNRYITDKRDGKYAHEKGLNVLLLRILMPQF